MFRNMVKLMMRCSKLEEMLKMKQINEQFKQEINKLNVEQLNGVIDLISQDQLINENKNNYLLEVIQQINDEKMKHLMLDKIMLPQQSWTQEQLKNIENILQNCTQQAIGLSIIGKMHAFYEYQNKQTLNNLIKSFDVTKTNAEQLGSACIGLALGQYQEKQLWDEITEYSLKIEKDFHSYMRIATGIGLANQGNIQFWSDFIEQFRKQLTIIKEDIFTQSLQVISQQNVVSLENCESEIEYYVINSQMRIENMISIYVSMARKQLGSQKFYCRLEQDIYDMQLYGDDLILYVIELMQVKERIPNQTLNVLVAKAYSESKNQELIERLSNLIK